MIPAGMFSRRKDSPLPGTFPAGKQHGREKNSDTRLFSVRHSLFSGVRQILRIITTYCFFFKLKDRFPCFFLFPKMSIISYKETQIYAKGKIERFSNKILDGCL